MNLTENTHDEDTLKDLPKCAYNDIDCNDLDNIFKEDKSKRRKYDEEILRKFRESI
jgi:hypothetical protein